MIGRELSSLPPNVRNAIEQEFKKLNDEINRLKKANRSFNDADKKAIRDIAKNEAHYYGASAISTWKVKDTIRVESEDIMRTPDIHIYRGGDLVIRGEVRVG